MPIKDHAKFQVAERKATMLRCVFYGTDGSGKTYTALRLGRHLVGGGDILVLDTEQVGADAPRSGQYQEFMHYVDPMPMRDILASPTKAYDLFIERVVGAIDSGAECVIIDSMTDENTAYMAQATATGETRQYYNGIKPKRVALAEVIKNAHCHIILCQRARSQGVWQQGADGKKGTIVRMAEQSEGSELFGYAMNLRIAMENITARIVKTVYETYLPEGAEFDMRTQWETFVDKVVSALDDGAITRERFMAELVTLGYPQSTWGQLWRAIPELGEWSEARHNDMLEMIMQLKDKTIG